MRKRIGVYGLGLGLLLSPFTVVNATQDKTNGAAVESAQPRYAYSETLDKILGEQGKKYRPYLVEAALVFDVPVDILAASVKTESDFQNRASSGSASTTGVGLAQITSYVWLQAGKSEKMRQLGLAHIFTPSNFRSSKGGYHPRLNLLSHAHALRYLYERFLEYPLVVKLPFDSAKSSIGWLVALAMYNGGERILSTIYDTRHEAKYNETNRLINWEKISPEDLIQLIRHGRGYHADWSRNAVANHLQKVIANLYAEPPLLQPVPVDIGRRVPTGKIPPAKRLYQTLNPGYNE